MGPDAHRIGELRSLAYHRIVAERIRTDPGIVARARAVVAASLAAGGRSNPYHLRWRELLDGPIDDMVATLTSDDEDSRALRSCTPFAGAITARERWALWREVRERIEAQP